ncbi:hypothetical protein K474DRAFT_1773089 [Panus rudis PR-1116 ss-1]|nr:hypothetical protein K474DRAFT_1773089 [Panus rudis PR-1116 ss-1]
MEDMANTRLQGLLRLARYSLNRMSFDDEGHTGHIRSANDMLPYLYQTFGIVQYHANPNLTTIPVAANPDLESDSSIPGSEPRFGRSRNRTLPAEEGGEDPSDADPNAQTQSPTAAVASEFCAKIMRSQPRNSVFILDVHRDILQLQRWDRGCMTFSSFSIIQGRPELNYQKDPGPLVDFLVNHSILPDEPSGLDRSATR